MITRTTCCCKLLMVVETFSCINRCKQWRWIPGGSSQQGMQALRLWHLPGPARKSYTPRDRWNRWCHTDDRSRCHVKTTSIHNIPMNEWRVIKSSPNFDLWEFNIALEHGSFNSIPFKYQRVSIPLGLLTSLRYPPSWLTSNKWSWTLIKSPLNIIESHSVPWKTPNNSQKVPLNPIRSNKKSHKNTIESLWKTIGTQRPNRDQSWPGPRGPAGM